MRILIADDNPEMRSFLKSILRGAGVDFTECHDGGEAIDCFAAVCPDWTIMDIAMKPVDGLTAARDITGRFSTARILMITQDANPRLKLAARSAGAWGFLLKDDLSRLPEIIFAGALCPNLGW